MTVQELIDELMEHDKNAEVRLASQPQWPFEYSIDEVVEVEEPVDGLVWGVFVKFEDGDEDFIESEDGSADEAEDRQYKMLRHDKAGIKMLSLGALYRGERISAKEARRLSSDQPRVVYIGEGLQLAYLNAEAAQLLGWK